MKFKSEEEMQEELKESIRTRKPDQSRDGYITAAEEVFEYTGVKYMIRVLRYYAHDGFGSIHRSRNSDYHVVVEYPDETKETHELVGDYISEFLYHDTLHSWCDNMDLDQQIEYCHKLAKEDIDDFFDGAAITAVNNQIADLEEKREKIRDKMKSYWRPKDEKIDESN